MKIIDSRKDFYDYLSKIYQDDYFTFDRRGSFYLEDYFEDIIRTKTDVCYWERYNSVGYFLLRIGYDNWIIEVKMNRGKFGYSLFHSFKDFNKVYKFQLGLIYFRSDSERYSFLDGGLEKKKDKVKNELLEKIKTPDFRLLYSVGFDISNCYRKGNIDKYALFEKCCISKLIQAFDIYHAFEDYFSAMKTEKNVDNRTNEEHIITHGFDTKESFRNIKG